MEMSDKVQAEFLKATDNVVRHGKRSLLDFVEMMEDQIIASHSAVGGEYGIVVKYVRDKTDQESKLTREGKLLWDFANRFKRRVHNDISIMGHQITAAFTIATNGGQIPAFGRSEQELASAEK